MIYISDVRVHQDVFDTSTSTRRSLTPGSKTITVTVEGTTEADLRQLANIAALNHWVGARMLQDIAQQQTGEQQT